MGPAQLHTCNLDARRERRDGLADLRLVDSVHLARVHEDARRLWAATGRRLGGLARDWDLDRLGGRGARRRDLDDRDGLGRLDRLDGRRRGGLALAPGPALAALTALAATSPVARVP